MIGPAVALVLRELNAFIRASDNSAPGVPDVVVADNISQLDHSPTANALENQLVLTLLNMDEEPTLKNGETAFRNPAGEVEYRNRPTFLNVTLLFSANFRNYTTALLRLSQTVTFFQYKRRFTMANSPGPIPGLDPSAEFDLTLNLLSLTLEEINHVWGALGGRALPFAAYRGRLVVVEHAEAAMSGGDITTIDIEAEHTV